MPEDTTHITVGRAWDDQYYGSMCGIPCPDDIFTPYRGIGFHYLGSSKVFAVDLVTCTACSLLYFAKKAEEENE